MSVTPEDVWLTVKNEPITQAAEKQCDFRQLASNNDKKSVDFTKLTIFKIDPDLQETY